MCSQRSCNKHFKINTPLSKRFPCFQNISWDANKKWTILPTKLSKIRGCNGTRTHNHLVRKRTVLGQFGQIRSVWLNGSLFVNKLSGCGFASRCSYLKFRYCTCFEQGVPWHSRNYKVWIHSETRTWHDNNVQLKPEVYLLFFKTAMTERFCKNNYQLKPV